MDYRTYAPSDALASFVKCYWTLHATAEFAGSTQRIIPDGCMELIIHFGDPYCQLLSDGKKAVQPRSFVFGQLTHTLEIEPTGSTGIVAARFHPDGFSIFSTMPLGQMANRAIPLSELYGEEGRTLEDEVLTVPTDPERIDAIQRFLTGRLQLPATADRLARESVDLLLKTKGQISVDGLVQDLNISRRSLERRFANAIGLSPKQLAKMVRLQTTLKLLEQKQFSNLSALAVEGGYFDQAHFIRDFNEFTGMTPRQFFQESLKMSSMFIGGH